jgi:hypothetical protein
MSRPVADQPKADWFQAVVKNPAAAEDTAIAIDARFANSAIPTKSISERTMRGTAGVFFVNVALVTRRVAAVGLFMILLLTAHGMAQSVRERLGEFAVLKTIGYSLGSSSPKPWRLPSWARAQALAWPHCWLHAFPNSCPPCSCQTHICRPPLSLRRLSPLSCWHS